MMFLLKFSCSVLTVFMVYLDGATCQIISNPSTLFDSQFSNSNTTSFQRNSSLFANFQSNGIKGYAIFSKDGQNTNIKVRIIDSPIKEAYNWKIINVMSDLIDNSCSSFVGNGIDLTSMLGMIQQVNSGQEIMFTASNLQLEGIDSLLGRTLLLNGMMSGSIACATILPAHKRIYQAKFHSPIEGTVTFIQGVGNGVTSLYSKLSYSNGTRKSTTHRWGMMSGSEEDASYEAQFRYERSQCDTFRGEPLFANIADPGPINVGLDPFSMKGRSFHSLSTNVDFDLQPVIYMIIFSNETFGDILACAPLHKMARKSASVIFNTQAIQGSFTFNQESSFDPTIVEMSIDLSQLAYSYGIDELPKIIRSKEETSKACPNIRSIIYNPKNVDPDAVPQQGMGTSDQYATGDLSGKYGTLANRNSERRRVVDYNLPLFGRFNVIGRALVIYAPDGPPIGCANIELKGTNITTAFATFDTPIQGQFIFRQSTNDCIDDTHIYLEISKPNEDNAQKTVNHLWHIHENAVNTGESHWSASNCNQAGSHLNPYNVSTECIYARDCSPITPLRCQVGDTSSKNGPIDIPPYRVTDDGELDIGKYFFTDISLPLCGPASIIGKSLVLHSADFVSNRLACANIIEYKPRATRPRS